MNQLNMFSNIPNIAGLSYIPEYITLEEEVELIQTIESQIWITELKRRVQHYGYKYDYKKHNINSGEYLDPMPTWLNDLCQKLYTKNIFANHPNQVIANEYMSGQGISAHIDCISCFGETICSLSLGSACIMDFDKDHKKERILLEPRSLMILQKDARYLWKHSIAARQKDRYCGSIFERERRISLTFRTVIT